VDGRRISEAISREFQTKKRSSMTNSWMEAGAGAAGGPAEVAPVKIWGEPPIAFEILLIK
jgi:hypothetical protein